jgi:hypothetical protein
MNDLWLVILTFISAVVSVMGVARNNYRFVLAGVIILLPVCFDLNGTVSFRGLILLPLFHIASIFSLNENRKNLAWLFLLPSILLELVFLFVFLMFGLMDDGAVY